MKRLGIIQSNYIPWKGYFDFIDSVDEFFILDDVQYTRRDWRNRNKIKTKEGLCWLTIPVESKGKFVQTIDKTEVAGRSWAKEHLASLRHAYARAPYFSDKWEWLSDLYGRASSMNMLSDVNELFLREIAEHVGIKTPIRRSSEISTCDGKNERLIAICRARGATEYLSGPAAQSYINEDDWQNHGIKIHYKSYSGYLKYEQLHPPFEDAVTVLDVLFHTGKDAYRFIKADDVERK